MTFYPEKKKYYLTEIEQMKSDGFTVKESYLNNVLKAKDWLLEEFFFCN